MIFKNEVADIVVPIKEEVQNEIIFYLKKHDIECEKNVPDYHQKGRIRYLGVPVYKFDEVLYDDFIEFISQFEGQYSYGRDYFWFVTYAKNIKNGKVIREKK